ncbi:unnamed protein product [Paramecium primaurelia]|uniref:Uncharacterized protein n=1 Tax=Paramecium primaurelia TaxID=5886 RepID=A0A8S1PPY0_PARPR|nr:unnamed protein product [Paramecium primaurelia]
MKTLIILTSLIASGLSQIVSGINDLLCNKYLEKFGTANSPDGAEATKLAFTGDIAFVSESTDVKINLKYSNLDLINDDTNSSITQVDGKTTTTTPCFDLKLWKFTSNSYSDPVEVTDLPITSDFQKQWRYYSFNIPKADLEKRLLKTQNTNQFIYKGFYAIAYQAAGTDQVYYTSYFEFSVTVDKATGAAVDTSFKPLSQTATLGCTPNEPCIAKVDNVLKWCTDLTCTSFATPDLHLNDQFFLQQVVTTPGLDYYLTGIEVWYTGKGLNKKATITSVNNNTKGQAIIILKAEIVWNQVIFQVISTLSDNQAGGGRLLVQTTYDPVTGETDEITCIKAEGKETCPTCEEECSAQGFAHDGCAECPGGEDTDVNNDNTSNGYILGGFITLLMLIQNLYINIQWQLLLFYTIQI